MRKRQRFDPLQEEEGVERADRRPDVALALHAGLDDVGDVGAEILDVEDVGKDQSVVARIGLGEAGELARCFPVERPAVDDDAADRRAVTAEELRQ